MMQPTLKGIEDIARAAGEILRLGYRKHHEVRHKGEKDLVTEIDQRSEALIIARIQQDYPGHTIVAEESGLTDGAVEHCWYIDPLDGTLNYAHGLPLFAVSIAYACQGEIQLGVVYDPMQDVCYTAQRGQGAWLNGECIHVSSETELVDSLLVGSISREPGGDDGPASSMALFAVFNDCAQSARRLGCAALDLCYVAAGQVDGYWVKKLNAWDVAAAGLIASEAGALVTDLHGESDYFHPPYCILAANPGLHGKLLKVLRQQGV
ncbi:MAG: inositol monophosphatase [Anaerolineaceae bacterium]|nr:inositol monophosphatase [Anaerolineaceae bacterium]